MADSAVHAHHCCYNHGCKYGDRNCPVSSGAIKQKHPCEHCPSNPLWWLGAETDLNQNPFSTQLDRSLANQLMESLGRDDPYPAGTRVIRQNTPDAHEPDPPKEYGIVVHSWWDDELGVQDYLVAFFGTEGFPTGPVSPYPYVLRYAHTSLRLAPC